MIRKSLPRIVIDARMVGDIPHGISRYVCQIAKGLEIQDRISKLPYEPIFLVSPHLKEEPFFPFKAQIAQTEFLDLKEIFEIPKLLKTLNAAFYHSPSFSSLFHCPCPSLITIHDLNHLSYGSFSKKLYYKTLLRRFALKSRQIMTVSEFSKNELAAWLRIPPEKIQIIYNALSDPQFKPQLNRDSSTIEEKFGLRPQQYFFCLSNSKPHKNIARLVTAYQNYSRGNQNAWPLVMTVKGIPKGTAQSYSDDPTSIPGIHSLGGLSDRDTATLLQHAGALFFPSIYEGFGIPPLEGALAGISLAISDIPPHREGLIDLSPKEVLWVDPFHVAGWTKAFHQMTLGEISPPTTSSQKKILARFSVEKMGQSIDQIYRHMIGSPE